MRLLDKYVLKETLVPVVYCVFAFSMLSTLLNVFDKVGKWVQAKASAWLIVCYAGAEWTRGAEFLLPSSLMFGILYGLWHLARNHEVSAMRSAGISVPRIMWPLMAVGAAVSIGAMALGEFVTPRATMWSDGVKRASFTTFSPDSVLTSVVYYNEAGRRNWRIGSMSIFNPATLNDVVINEEETATRPRRQIMARRAEYLDGTWWLRGMQEIKYLKDGGPIHQGRPFPPEPDPDSVREMDGWTETPLAMAVSLKDSDYLTSREAFAYLDAHPNLAKVKKNGMRVDAHQRLALPWACFVVTLFVIPVGTQSGRQNALRGVFFATACFLGYYAIMQTGLFLGRRGTIPPWVGAWLANVVFAVSGTVMLARSR